MTMEKQLAQRHTTHIKTVIFIEVQIQRKNHMLKQFLSIKRIIIIILVRYISTILTLINLFLISLPKISSLIFNHKCIVKNKNLQNMMFYSSSRRISKRKTRLLSRSKTFFYSQNHLDKALIPRCTELFIRKQE